MSVPGAAYMQRANRSWQCQARQYIDNISVHPDIAYHVCQQPAGHMSNHLCWCGSVFRPDVDVWTQARLPELPIIGL